MRAVIEAEGVGKTYRTKAGEVGLRELSLEVEKGQVLALLGPNGAGKTTAVRGLSTLLRFDRGRARVAGHDVRAEATQVRSRIALVGQSAAVDDQLAAKQNLMLFGRLRGLSRADAAKRSGELIQQFGLAEAQDRAVGGFSGGMRRKLDVAASMIVRPEVLFVDEPTTGLDPAARRDLWQALSMLLNEGTTVLLTTQYLEEADQLADQIVLLSRGVVIAQGTPDELKDAVGPSVIQIRFDSEADARTALTRLTAVDPEAALNDAGIEVSLHAVGSDALGRSVRTLTELGFSPNEVTLRKPSLDEVFLTLTGDTPESSSPATNKENR
ncbi:MAG TPA: ATP-binding cassette domain-containing protein [Actinomycetaceae bacterium]|nr:ATP-binding cassette domain-containing protein [Actinomycetaceae bacterium]